MKIFITTFTFAPLVNGVAEVVREQVCGLAARGHEVTVATLQEPRRTAADAFGSLQIREFRVGGSYAACGGNTDEVAADQVFIARHFGAAAELTCEQTRAFGHRVVIAKLRKHAG